MKSFKEFLTESETIPLEAAWEATKKVVKDVEAFMNSLTDWEVDRSANSGPGPLTKGWRLKAPKKSSHVSVDLVWGGLIGTLALGPKGIEIWKRGMTTFPRTPTLFVSKEMEAKYMKNLGTVLAKIKSFVKTV